MLKVLVAIRKNATLQVALRHLKLVFFQQRSNLPMDRYVTGSTINSVRILPITRYCV